MTNNSINELLNIMYEATENSTDFVFTSYLNIKDSKTKPIFNLFAESFIGIKSFSLLMMNKVWSQAATILRVLIEQVSVLFVLSFYPQIINEYLKFDNLKRQYYSLENKNERIEFIKKKGLKLNTKTIIEYLDYGWIKPLTKTGTYGRDQIIAVAYLDEFKVDIKEFLNKFAHGKISIFDFYSKERGWAPMADYGKRMCLICCKLFDFLVCSYSKWTVEDMVNKTTKNLFKQFKIRYRSILK